jgi:hypothetical protein
MNTSAILTAIAPRVMAAVTRHPGDRDLRAAIDYLAAASAPATLAAPDYYAQLADRLHEVAEHIATLTGTHLDIPWYAQLTIAGASTPSDAERGKPIVEAIAAALGLTPTTVRWPNSNDTWQYKAHVEGTLDIDIHTRVPAPPDPRDQEIAQLRAELAARDAGPTFPVAAPARPQPDSPVIADPVDEVDVTALPLLVQPGPQADRAVASRQCGPDCPGAPHDGHVYACCGKVGRLSRHEQWCHTMALAASDGAA